jgi:hypothetical protein
MMLISCGTVSHNCDRLCGADTPQFIHAGDLTGLICGTSFKAHFWVYACTELVPGGAQSMCSICEVRKSLRVALSPLVHGMSRGPPVSHTILTI